MRYRIEEVNYLETKLLSQAQYRPVAVRLAEAAHNDNWQRTIQVYDTVEHRVVWMRRDERQGGRE